MPLAGSDSPPIAEWHASWASFSPKQACMNTEHLWGEFPKDATRLFILRSLGLMLLLDRLFVFESSHLQKY